METIGQRITALRKDKSKQIGRRFTQADLAKKMNVEEKQISKWENDEIKLSADKIIRLADFFEVSTDYLLRGGEINHLVMMNETGLSDQTIKRMKENKEMDEKSSSRDIWDVSKFAKMINLLFDEKIIEKSCEGQSFTTTDGEILLASLYDFILCDDLPMFDCTDKGEYIGSQSALYQIRVINDLQQLRKDYQRTRAPEIKDQKKESDDQGRDAICLTKEHLF